MRAVRKELLCKTFIPVPYVQEIERFKLRINKLDNPRAYKEGGGGGGGMPTPLIRFFLKYSPDELSSTCTLFRRTNDPNWTAIRIIVLNERFNPINDTKQTALVFALKRIQLN